MKFLADENIPQSFIRYIKSKGHDTVDSKKEHPSAKDNDSEVGVILLYFPKSKTVDILPWIDKTLDSLEQGTIVTPFRLIVQKESITLQK